MSVIFHIAAREDWDRAVGAGAYTMAAPHGDGFIHTHPFTRSEGGDNATLGRFLGYGGWGVSEDSIDLGADTTAWAGLPADPGKRTWSDGDTCPPERVCHIIA